MTKEASQHSPNHMPCLLTHRSALHSTPLQYRKHLGSSRGVWEGMEAKALDWLAAQWPTSGGQVKSLGATVLQAMRVV